MVVSVVDPRNLPDDLMRMVEKEVMTDDQAKVIAEVKDKIKEKRLQRAIKMKEIPRDTEMLQVWKMVPQEIEKDTNKSEVVKMEQLQDVKERIAGWKKRIEKSNQEVRELDAEIEKLEAQVRDAPEMRNLHKKLFQNNT